MHGVLACRPAPRADGAANCRRARRAAGREKRMPTCRRQVGKATQPLGVVADRFDGLAQGKKRAQAGSGTAALRAGVCVDETSSEGTGDDFHGVPGTLRSKMTGTTPAQSKLVPRVRPMAAKQTAGLSGTPAACGYGLDSEHAVGIAGTCSAMGCGGGRLRARNSGGRGGRPPAFFRRRSPAREPRAAAEATSPPLKGRKAPGVAVDQRARKRTPCWMTRSAT
jgi:hypothetical protein